MIEYGRRAWDGTGSIVPLRKKMYPEVIENWALPVVDLDSKNAL